MNPKVSVIIPAYNVEDFLERCVESVVCQTYSNLEIIIVDDGSTDGTASIGKKLESDDERIKYEYQENRGLPSARNTGMKSATGKYVFFLDSDDTIDCDLIKQLIDKREQNVLIGSNIKNIFPKKAIKLNREGEYNKDDFLSEIFEDKKPSFVCGYLFDLDKCKNISFDEITRYYEDILFLVRYLNNGINKVILLPEIYYNYYQNPKSITLSSANIMEKLKDIVIATEKTNGETDNKFAEKNNNREVGLFEAILQHADEKVLKKVLKQFSLPEYTGNSRRIRLFVRLYAKKNIKGLIKYYKIRSICKSLIMRFM